MKPTDFTVIFDSTEAVLLEDPLFLQALEDSSDLMEELEALKAFQESLREEQDDCITMTTA